MQTAAWPHPSDVALLGQSLSGIDPQWIVGAIVIVIWVGSFLMNFYKTQQKKAAQKARLEASGERASVEAETMNRRGSRVDASDPGIVWETPPQRPSIGPRPSASAASAAKPSGKGAEPTPPDLRDLFKDPQAYLQQWEQYAESQSAEGDGSASSQVRADRSATPSATRSVGSGSGASSAGGTRVNPPITSGGRLASSAIPRPANRPVQGAGARTSRSTVARSESSRRPAGSGRTSSSIAADPPTQRSSPPATAGPTMTPGPTATRVHPRLGPLDADALRRAFLLNEILQPPVALRQQHLKGTDAG